MSWRTVIVSGRSKLDYRMGYLVVRSHEVRRVFLEEISILVIENPAVSLTGSLLEALVARKIRVIFCDTTHNPISELTPHHGSHDSSLKIKQQISWEQPVKDAMWQHIICEKIQKQADLLLEQKKEREYSLLLSYISQVLPGDISNREGHASKVYFNALFGMDFTRSADRPENAALNYGYAVLLSAVNREICALGYLTQLGIFHDNRFNHFNLGCELMEPFRPLIDRKVLQYCSERFDRDEKRVLWNVLNDTVKISGARQTVLNALRIYVHRITDALCHGDPDTAIFYELT